MLNLRHLLANGGVSAQQAKNEAKANLLYNEIDSNPSFKGAVATEDRSQMNVTFLLTDESRSAEFDTMWKAAGIVGLPGHRSVGGYRASMYNALPLESVQVLVDVMKAFNSKG
jgi:phosphoserine aminotransferase